MQHINTIQGTTQYRGGYWQEQAQEQEQEQEREQEQVQEHEQETGKRLLVNVRELYAEACLQMPVTRLCSDVL